MDLKKLQKLSDTKVLEADIEAYLVAEVKARGGKAYKFTSPQRRAVPDRHCLLPGGVSFFVECKRPGETLTPSQQREAEYLRSLGQTVYAVSTFKEVDALWEDNIFTL